MATEDELALLWPDEEIPAPSKVDILSQIAHFLDQLGYINTFSALVKEAKEGGVNVDIAAWERGIDTGSGVGLLELYQSWHRQNDEYPTLPSPDEDVAIPVKKLSKASRKSASEAQGAVAAGLVDTGARGRSDGSLEDETESSSDSGSSSAGPVGIGVKRKRAASSSNSSSESSSDDSSSDSSSEEDDSQPAKRPKISTGSDTSSASGTHSDSESSDSDAEINPDRGNGHSSESDSTSESSSGSSSGSDSDSDSTSESDSSGASKHEHERKSKKVPPANSQSAKSSKIGSAGEVVDKGSMQRLSQIKAANNVSRSQSSSTLDAESAGEKGRETDQLLAPSHTHPDRVKRIDATKKNIAQLKKNQVPFSRIPTSQTVDPRFASNEYIPYDYADRAFRDLSVTKGKGFTKEKNKKKRGAYRGGVIDIAPKGIKFDD